MEILKNIDFSEAMEQLDMNVSDLSYAILGGDWQCDNARAAVTRVYFVLAGEGELFCGRARVRLLPGHIYIVPSGMQFGYGCPERLEKLFCHVKLLRYRHEDLFEGCDALIDLPDKEEDVAAALACFRGGKIADAIRFRGLLYRLLWEGLAACGFDPSRLRKYGELTQKAIRYIEENLRAGLSAAEVASRLYVSESYLQKTFRREVGRPFGKYVTECVLAEAERALRLSDRPVGEISDALGFCDRFYFSRLFAARYELPPARYRKNVNV